MTYTVKTFKNRDLAIHPPCVEMRKGCPDNVIHNQVNQKNENVIQRYEKSSINFVVNKR